MKIRIATKLLKPVASNYSAREFLAEAHIRFPQPSPFLAEFLQRFEALTDLEDAVDKRQYGEQQIEQDVQCEACGHQMTILVEQEPLV